jgi:hypothetical protein
MNYRGYIVINNDTGNIIGAYPRAGQAPHYTRLGDWDGEGDLEGCTVVFIDGES